MICFFFIDFLLCFICKVFVFNAKIIFQVLQHVCTQYIQHCIHHNCCNDDAIFPQYHYHKIFLLFYCTLCTCAQECNDCDRNSFVYSVSFPNIFLVLILFCMHHKQHCISQKIATRHKQTKNHYTDRGCLQKNKNREKQRQKRRMKLKNQSQLSQTTNHVRLRFPSPHAIDQNLPSLLGEPHPISLQMWFLFCSFLH